jgi:predicted MPP superfamily phosphohydrolase
MWGVLGNHDYWTTEAAKVENAMCGAGCEIVTNRSVRLRNGVRVAGIDDRMAGAPDMRLAFGAVKKDEPLLAMAHNPLSFRDTTDIPMTMFAGHTHGGQVLFPGRSGFLERKYGYVAGWYSRGRSTLYVNRGIGTVIVPFRLFARPEVSVFDFLPENEA